VSRSRSTAPIDISLLSSMSLADLRAAWAGHMGRSPPPAQRRLLIRELAWRIQEREHGGLDARTRWLLNAAIRNAKKAEEQLSGDQAVPSLEVRKRASPLRAGLPALQANTRLVRTWRGKRHEVVVLEGGRTFRYRDRTYDNLSEIARGITGVRWSGPRFFGLRVRVHGKTK